jgi:hypothetical protein
MSYLVVLVVNDVDHIPAILEAWEAAGAPGVTILESSGLGRVRRAGLLEDIPLMPSLRDLFTSPEVHHNTLFTVVETETIANEVTACTQAITGNLEEPHSGFMFVAPVLKTFGMGRNRVDRSQE